MPSEANTPTVRAAIYARYSSDLQCEASINDQVRVCAERAAKEGWQVVESYTDQGVSGASLIRPGIRKLLRCRRREVRRHPRRSPAPRVPRPGGHRPRLQADALPRHQIVTPSDSEVNELHVGLKGTMNALYLKDLADKTRGRIEAGKSGGGNSYRYEVVKKIDANGEPVRGKRRINPQQAAVVKRIFNDYARGVSPRAIAKQLNRDGVPGPSGKGWGPSTIHGNWQRGTGILNNELYIGRHVWNRQRFPKDPQTGKRISRLIPPSEWVRRELPELRIIDQDLWHQVKARQVALQGTRSGGSGPGYWDRRRPRYLFTGLMRCGMCGGGVATWNRLYVGCVNARNKGTNKRTMRRDELEAVVLEGLQHRLMDPDLMAVFCEEIHPPRECADSGAQRRPRRREGRTRQGQPRSRPPRQAPP